MTELKFTIYGNQENPDGNPIPYTRMIAGQWRADSSRYVAWQNYVRKCFSDQVRMMNVPIIIDDAYVKNPEGSRVLRPSQITQFPINLTAQKSIARIELDVFSADGTIGDLDNILKGVLDSLFKNDKCVVEFHCKLHISATKKGRIEAKINLEERK